MTDKPQATRAAKANRNADIVDRLEAEIELLTAALQRNDSWIRAYPVKGFPAPAFHKAAELLKAGGITLDAIRASNMRNVVEWVGKSARDALLAAAQRDKP